MPILAASYDEPLLPSLNNIEGIQIEGVDPSATAEADASAAAAMQDQQDKAELRSALRNIRRYQPPPITALYNQPNVANSPRFARSTFYGGSSVGDPILPGGYTPPDLSPSDGAGPSSPLFPQTPVESPNPLEDPLELSKPGPSEDGNILLEPKPEGLPDAPLEEEDAAPALPEETVADPTALNDIYRKFNPGRLYRIFSV